MRDTVAEMAERAQIISQEAGSKVAAAMKDVISAAAGIAGFALESARDLVQYMVRRGQMTQEEADKLLREAEEAHGRRPASERSRPTATKVTAERNAIARAEAASAAAAAAAVAHAAHTASRAAAVHAAQAAHAASTAKHTASHAKPHQAAPPKKTAPASAKKSDKSPAGKKKKR